MKSRGVVGKRIVKIEQSMKMSNVGMTNAVAAIVLEDGTRLIPSTIETEDEYLTEIAVNTTGRSQPF